MLLLIPYSSSSHPSHFLSSFPVDNPKINLMIALTKATIRKIIQVICQAPVKKLTNKYTIFLGYNEYLVTYTNLSSVCVKKGDVVKKDQKIGVIGSGVDANDKPFVRLAIYDSKTEKPLYVSDFFKKL